MTRGELDALKEKIAKYKEAQEKIESVANMFSNSIWKLLPNSIKVVFEEYRTK